MLATPTGNSTIDSLAPAAARYVATLTGAESLRDIFLVAALLAAEPTPA